MDKTAIKPPNFGPNFVFLASCSASKEQILHVYFTQRRTRIDFVVEGSLEFYLEIIHEVYVSKREGGGGFGPNHGFCPYEHLRVMWWGEKLRDFPRGVKFQFFFEICLELSKMARTLIEKCSQNFQCASPDHLCSQFSCHKFQRQGHGLS